jgi:hypothetical protein
MYARFCLARYGDLAPQRVSAKAKFLAETGDVEGEQIWKAVAVEVQRRMDSRGKELTPYFIAH